MSHSLLKLYSCDRQVVANGVGGAFLAMSPTATPHAASHSPTIALQNAVTLSMASFQEHLIPLNPLNEGREAQRMATHLWTHCSLCLPLNYDDVAHFYYLQRKP